MANYTCQICGGPTEQCERSLEDGRLACLACCVTDARKLIVTTILDDDRFGDLYGSDVIRRALEPLAPSPRAGDSMMWDEQTRSMWPVKATPPISTPSPPPTPR